MTFFVLGIIIITALGIINIVNLANLKTIPSVFSTRAMEYARFSITPPRRGWIPKEGDARQEALRLLQASRPPWWQELPKRPCHGGLLGASASDFSAIFKIAPPSHKIHRKML